MKEREKVRRYFLGRLRKIDGQYIKTDAGEVFVVKKSDAENALCFNNSKDIERFLSGEYPE